MKSFLNFANKLAPSVAAALGGKAPGSTAFNQSWKQLASKDPVAFKQVQHKFIQGSHFEPVVKKLAESGFDVKGRSQALQDVVWSTAVQHGVGGATTVIKNAMAGKKNMSDAELIRRIYAERGANNGAKYFGSSSPEVRKGVVNRFKKEMQDALGMLNDFV